MEDRDRIIKYTPVSCDLIDHIEIMATRRQRTTFILGTKTEQHHFTGRIKTWFTKDKVEYAEFQGGYQVRLDRLLAIEGFSDNDSGCKV